MTLFANYINGEWVSSGQTFDNRNPANIDEVVGQFAKGRPSDVAAAADAPAVFAEQHPNSCRLLLTMPRDELLDPELPDEIASEISDLETALVGLLIRLARSVWDRKDAAAVDTITMCIVDLPTAILLRRDRLRSETAREQLRAAVRAVLEFEPPAIRQTERTTP